MVEEEEQGRSSASRVTDGQSSIRTQTQLEMYIEQTQAENTNQQKGHEVIMDLPPSDKAAPNEIEGKICDGNVSWLPSHSATVAAPITISIQKHQSTRTVCSGRCQCSCHQPGQCYTPRALNDLIGYLFLGYSGIPWLSSSCDIRSCAHVYQNFSMQFRWILPSWVGSRMIAATIFSSTKYGPEFHLRIPAVRPRTDPIFSLVMQGDIEGIQSEFRKGSASPFDVDEAGYSLVWFALSAFNHRILETCQFLLHEGADPLDEESRDPKRLWTTFDCAWILILGKQVSLSAALGLRIIFDNSDRLINPRFPLLHEIVLGFVNLDLLAYLDTFTGDIDQTDAYGRTALEWAVARNDVAAVRAFLDRGADSSRGSWALSHSISGPASDRATIESLTRFKQDIGTSDRRDDTMLIEACQHNNPEAIRALLSLGADINARNNYGFTALHYAAYWNRHECLAVLLESHADCSLQTNNGHNILYITMTSGDIRTLEIIGKAPTLFRSEMVVCPKFTFEDIRQFRDQIRENSLGKEWWEAWKRLLGRFSGAAVEDSGVLEPERGHDEQNSWNEISYSEDEDGGIFVDAVERLEAVEA
ncbi:ankyrin [Glonium stellatum]|uniref:Ankyrin n=1 Tax=Glonium stellatum TaxID=574774 RepID=A0A8E2F174_9PEZI|nr:ankyrin [Glonium stellatum]